MASKTIKLVGRTSDFKGKPLWEILGNLKNFGVGRLVIRQMFQRYPEPCYMKVVKVEAQPNPIEPYEARKVKVWVEKVFRGRRYPNLVELLSTSYKADYQLVPKDKELEFTQSTKNVLEKILPQTVGFPPLLGEFITAETGNPNPVMPVRILKAKCKNVRIAKAGEKPNLTITMGLGKPVSPKLYEGLNV